MNDSDSDGGDASDEDFSEHANAKNGKITEVRMLPYVFKIDRVDAITMTAFAHIEVALRWKDDRVIEEYQDDSEPYYRVKESLLEDPDDPEDECWEKIWRPNLILDNIIGDEGEEGEISDMGVCKDPRTDEPMLYMYRIYRNTVRIDMDLRTFPFDRQCITFYFMLQDQPSSDCSLQLHQISHLLDGTGCLDPNVDGAADGYTLMGCRFVPHPAEEQWAEVMSKHGLLTERERKSWTETGGQAKFPKVELRFDTCRESFFFISKIVAVVYVLLLMEIATFFMAVDDLGTRSSVTLTLFLTAVAFQFAVGSDLPKLPYLTSLDLLMLFMYIMMFIAYVENMVVFQIVQSAIEDGESEDDAKAMASFVDWAFTVFFCVMIVISVAILAVRRHFAIRRPIDAYQKLYPDTLETVDQTELKQVDATVLSRIKQQIALASKQGETVQGWHASMNVDIAKTSDNDSTNLAATEDEHSNAASI